MMTPNPRSLGDSFPDDPRSLDPNKEAAEENEGGDNAGDSRRSESRDGQSFQDPMTEEDVASGGPADPPKS